MSINGNTPPEGGQTAAIDPFDPASLRLAQSFAEKAGVRKLINTIPVRRPNRQNFVIVRHEPDYRLTPAGIFEVKEDREVYLVVPQMATASGRVCSGDFIYRYHPARRASHLAS